MRVFISWSGETSRRLAEVINGWLPAVIQAVKPYYSPDDITKGSRWSGEIAKILEESRVGLICLTKNNVDAPWIMFESGALSKNLDRSKVTPILFGVEPTDLIGPLVQFQAAKFEKKDLRRVVGMVNTELGEQKLPTSVLDSVFEVWWPKLESDVYKVMADAEGEPSSAPRPQRDLLEEILLLTRSQARWTPLGASLTRRTISDLVDGYATLIRDAAAYGGCAPLSDGFQLIGKPLRHLVRSASRGRPDKDTALMIAWAKAEADLQKSLSSPVEDDDDDLPF